MQVPHDGLYGLPVTLCGGHTSIILIACKFSQLASRHTQSYEAVFCAKFRKAGGEWNIELTRATANFFVKYFDFKLQPASNVKYVSVLKGSGGFVLVLSNLANTPTHNYPKDFHIGFYQTDHHAVDLLYEK